MEKWITLTPLSGLKENTIYPFQISGAEVILVLHKGEPKAYEAYCPHQKAALENGSLSNGKLTCNAHGWSFDVDSGKNCEKEKPCLKTFSLRIAGHVVEIDENSLTPSNKVKEVATRRIKDLPRPPRNWLLGNFRELKRTDFHVQLEKWQDEFPDVFSFQMGRQKMVVFSEPEDIQQIILERPNKYRRNSSISTLFTSLRGDGVFSNEGARWARERALTMPSFNSAHLIDFFPALTKFNGRFLKKLSGLAKEGRDIRLLAEFMRFTVDVTTELAFGYDMNTIETDGDVIQQKLTVLFPAFMRRLTAPFPYWKYFKLRKDRLIDKALDDIFVVLEGILEENKKKMEANPELREKPTNFLQGFLAAGGLTNEEIFGNLLTILLAGEDTTANSMGWTIHCIQENIHVQKKIQEEVDSVLGNSAYPTEYKQIEKLRYLDAVITETLRIKSVAPFLFLETNFDTVTRGIDTPKGTGIVGYTEYAAKQDKYFSRAKTFAPERWLAEHRSEYPIHTPKAFAPFGGGPRYCPGRNLAMLEMKAVMAMIFKNFEVGKPKVGQSVKDKFTFVRVPGNLFAQLNPR